MMNIGYVEIRGCDVNVSSTLCFAGEVYLSLAGAYTYQKAQDFSDSREPLTYGGQIAYIPWHSVSAMANLRWQNLSINYAFVYVGERYQHSANIMENYQQPWYTHDIALTYEAVFSDKPTIPRLHFSVEINNMLNQQYEVILNYPMPGINGKTVVKILF